MFRSKYILVILTALVALGISVSSAHAASWNPEYQAHLGACAKSTSSISTGVEDLNHNNVLDEFAAEFGIHGPDGPKFLMKHELVEGVIAKTVVTNNYGCENDTGHVFWYDHRELHKGEHVMTVPTSSEFKGEVCKHVNGAGCHRVEIIVSTVLPISCWNKNHEVTIRVLIGVRKPKHHHHKPHRKPTCHTRHSCKHPKQPCGCSKQPIPTPTPTPKTPEEGGKCNGNNVNNGSGSAGNCNHCVGVNVCNETPEEHHEPPCSCTPEKSPPEIISELHIQEVYINEKIVFHATIAAPSGDHLTILFVDTENGWFSPSEIDVPSFGGQDQFESYFYSPSEPGVEYIHVKVIDDTTGKHAEKTQKVEVLPTEENPS